MDCKGCLLKFDEKLRRPLILVECGHSVCKTCIGQAIDQVMPEAASMSLNKSKSLTKTSGVKSQRADSAQKPSTPRLTDSTKSVHCL